MNAPIRFRVFPLVLLSLSTLLGAGCEKPKVVLNPAEIAFTSQDTADKTVTLTLDPECKDTEWTVSGMADWFGIDPASGKGNATLTAKLLLDKLPAGEAEATILVSGKDLKDTGSFKVRWSRLTAPVEGEPPAEGEAVDPNAPSKTTGVQAFPGAKSITMKWRANNETGLKGYNVYRTDNLATAWTKLTATPISALRFTDESSPVGKTLYYYIAAVNQKDVVGPASDSESAAAGSVKFMNFTSVGRPSAEVHIPVAVANATGLSARNLSVTLSYNAAELSFTSVNVQATGVAAGLFPAVDTSQQGKIVITANDPAFLFKGEGRMFDVVATISAAVGYDSYPISVTDAYLYDTQSANKAGIDFGQASVLEVSDSCYYGDMDASTVVEKADANDMLKIVVGEINPATDYHWKAGELNADSLLDTADAVIILRIAKGMRYTPPVGTPSLRDILSAGNSIEITIPQIQAAVNGVVAVPVNINNGNGLSAFAATIVYPADGALAFDNAQLGALTADFPGFRFWTEPGVVHIAGAREQPLYGQDASGGSIATLYFQVKSDAPIGESTSIEVNGVELKGEYADDFAWYTGVEQVDGSVVVAQQTTTETPVIGLVGDVTFTRSTDPSKTFPVMFAPDNPDTTWTISGGAAWFSCAPTSGTGSTRTDAPISVSLIPASLPSDVASATLTITASGGVQPREVTVVWQPEVSEAELRLLADEMLPLFDSADDNFDGKLSYDEARTVVSTLSVSAFRTLDTNRDNLLMRFELQVHTAVAPSNQTPTPGTMAGEVRTFAGMSFVWCPPGTLLIGSPDTETDRGIDESPQTSHTLSTGFWMGQYEVTEAQWEAIMGTDPLPYFFVEGNANLPMESMTWTQAQSYVSTLSAQYSGYTFRLPTEVEWEYACRAGSTARFPWGDDPTYSTLPLYAWYETNSELLIYAGSSRQSNPWNIYNMHGNVAEWCSDAYTNTYGGVATSAKVTRGGSYTQPASNCRSANRESTASDSYASDIGVRIVLEAWQ